MANFWRRSRYVGDKLKHVIARQIPSVEPSVIVLACFHRSASNLVRHALDKALTGRTIGR
jgi:hypothetical protein